MPRKPKGKLAQQAASWKDAPTKEMPAARAPKPEVPKAIREASTKQLNKHVDKAIERIRVEPPKVPEVPKPALQTAKKAAAKAPKQGLIRRAAGGVGRLASAGKAVGKFAIKKVAAPVGVALDVAAAAEAGYEGYQASKAYQHRETQARGAARYGVQAEAPRMNLKDALGMVAIPGYEPAAADIRNIRVTVKPDAIASARKERKRLQGGSK